GGVVSPAGPRLRLRAVRRAGVSGRAPVRRRLRFARPGRGRAAPLAGVDREIGGVLVAGRADRAGRALARLGAVGPDIGVSGPALERAAALPLDELDAGRLRGRQLLRAARLAAGTPGAVSLG